MSGSDCGLEDGRVEEKGDPRAGMGPERERVRGGRGRWSRVGRSQAPAIADEGNQCTQVSLENRSFGEGPADREIAISKLRSDLRSITVAVGRPEGPDSYQELFQRRRDDPKDDR